MTDKLYFGATPIENHQPKKFMPSSLLKKLSAVCFGLALCGPLDRASAQFSVGPSGLPAQAFGAAPAVADVSTLSVPSGGGNAALITTGPQLDTAVQTNLATAVVTALVPNGTVPPASLGNAQWNSAGFYLQTRPTGNSFTLLMATLRNNTGSNVVSVVISYNLGALIAAGSAIGEEIPGHRAYFSQNGAAGTWVRIPEFDSATAASAGARSAILNLGNWAPSANLYLLWADDNGSSGATGPTQEGGYTIDDLAVTATPAQPGPSIINQPVAQSVAPGSPATFSVTVAGNTPLSYQWLKNSNAIVGATSSTYTINSTVLGDQGFYSVRVTNAFGAVTSTNVFLSVACATPVSFVNQPGNQSLNSGGTLGLTASTAGTQPITYQWYRNGVALPGATSATYTKNNAQSSDSGLYHVVASNCGGPVTSASVVVSVSDAPFELVGLTNQVWKYDQSGTDLGTAWQAPGYNDAAWPSGPGLLAVENNVAITPLINTVLSLSNASARIVTYYFRAQFTVTNDLALISLVSSNFFDDAAVVYLNGSEAFRYNMPDGNVTYTTQGLAANPAGEGVPIVSNLPPSLVVSGVNVLAVEVHQSGAASSDIVFGMAVLVNALPPSRLVITDQPQSVAVVETKPAVLTLGLQGQPAYYQWFKDGVPLAGGTSNPLVFPIATINDAGTYYVVATNSINSVTSSLATITILADTNPPTLVEADGTASTTNILVSFSELVAATAATNISSYRVTNTVGGALLTILRATPQNGTNVMLHTSARTAGANYILVVNNLRDLSPRANLIVTNSSIPVRSRVPVLAMNASGLYYDPFPPFDVEDLGTAWREFTYNTAGWGNGSAVYYDGPDAGDVPAAVGSSLSQTPTVTSYFRNNFTLAASPGGLQLQLSHVVDDGAVFYLNGVEVYRFNMPAGTVNYLTPASSTINNIARLGPINLPLGSLRQGANVLATELHQITSIDTDKAYGAQIDAAAQSYIVGPVVITAGPQDLTVVEGSTATFRVVQAGGATFQWQSNSVRIASATNDTYSIPAVTFALNGALFRVAVSNSTSVLFSTNATLRVVADTNGPLLLSAYANLDNTFTLSFSEPITAATANNLANYTVTNSFGVGLTVNGITFTNGTNVILRFLSYVPASYAVRVSGLRDASLAANLMLPSLASVGLNVLIPLDASWKFNQTGSDLGTAWKDLNYNDSAAGWSNGPGLLYVEGAGLPGPKNTPLSLIGPNGTGPDGYVFTYYFRKGVYLPVNALNATYGLRHVVDDGVVFYANASEFLRFNMAAGDVAFNTLANVTAGDAVSVGPVSFNNLLTAGTNMLAAEVHQASAASSDIVFGGELSIVIPSGVTVISAPGCIPNSPVAPPLNIVRQGGSVALSWINPSLSCPPGALAAFTLQRATNLLSAGTVWVNVGTNTSVTVPATNASLYYRLKY